jgi:hypothetical protein
MRGLLSNGARLWRKVAGNDTRLERVLRHQHFALRSALARKIVGENCVVFWSRPRGVNRVGIYVKGSCDLVSLFSTQPMIHEVLSGTCCILREGMVSDSRSDLLLQTLQGVPQEWLQPVRDRLKLPSDYFEPRLFAPTMTVPGLHGNEELRKSVIVLSIGADALRTVYQHREHGFLVDPGGWWQANTVTAALADLGAAKWFREHFVNIGRISLDAFRDNFSRIIRRLKQDTSAHILVFNVLTVDPGSLTHTYQFVKDPLGIRHREFNLALVELSRELDFSIVDMDRILKQVGVGNQMDFAHFPPDRYEPVAREVFRILMDRGVFSRPADLSARKE